jgi:hypothetical protein
MATFIHTSDWGLYDPPADLPGLKISVKWGPGLSDYELIRRVGEVAREHHADFVLVMGRIFSSPTPSRDLIAGAIRAIAEIDLPVMLVPGGLDDGASGSVWVDEFFVSEAARWAPNLRVLLSSEPVEQEGYLLCPLFSRGSVASLRDGWADVCRQIAANGRWSSSPLPRIMILPDGLGADEQDSAVAAFLDDAVIAEIDYVALAGGDGVSELAPKAWQSGNPGRDQGFGDHEHEINHVAMVFACRGERPRVHAVATSWSRVNLAVCYSCPRTEPTDDNVQFTVFRPQVVAPAKWYDLVAAAHLDAARPEADPSEPTPLERVQAKAKAMLGDRFDDYAPLTHDALQGVPQGSELTFAFEMPGVEFNPPRVSFGWFEDEHTVQVRLRAAPSLDGKTARGRMTVFLGAIILADVPFSLRVDAARATDRPRLEPEREAIRRYRRIFASYSHRDLPIVEQFERFVEATGDRYLRDHKVLRAGEAWDDRLLELISEADVFQLFWSRNALASPHVRREWEHALSLGRDNFIRPVYWESPLPQAAGLPPEPLTRIHFQFLGAITAGVEEQQRPSEADEIVGGDDSSDEASLAASEDCLEMELGCADFDESEPDLESTGLALEEDGESADFPTEAAMASVSPPSMARVPPQASCPPPVMIEDDLKHSFNAGWPADISCRRSSSRGILVGFFIGMVVVSFIMGLIASLLSGD